MKIIWNHFRYTLNFTAAAFIFIGTIFDVGVWYLVKNLKIFDESSVKKTDAGTEEEQETMLAKEKL